MLKGSSWRVQHLLGPVRAPQPSTVEAKPCRHVFVGATLGYLGAIHNPPTSENPCHLSGRLPGTSKSQLGKLLPRRLVSRNVEMQNAACGSSKDAGNSAGSGSTSSPGNIAIPKTKADSSLLKSQTKFLRRPFKPAYPQRINKSRSCKQAVQMNDVYVPPSSCIWDSKSCLKVNKASRRNEDMEIIGIGWLLLYRPSIISTWLDLVTKTHDHINVQGRSCKIWLQATPFRKSSLSQDATKCWHSSGHQWNAQSWRGRHFCRPQGHEIHLDLKISRGANEVDVCGGCRMPFLGPPDGEGAISIEGHVWSWNCFGPMTARSILCLEKLKGLRIRQIHFFTMIYTVLNVDQLPTTTVCTPSVHVQPEGHLASKSPET